MTMPRRDDPDEPLVGCDIDRYIADELYRAWTDEIERLCREVLGDAPTRPEDS